MFVDSYLVLANAVAIGFNASLKLRHRIVQPAISLVNGLELSVELVSHGFEFFDHAILVRVEDLLKHDFFLPLLLHEFLYVFELLSVVSDLRCIFLVQVYRFSVVVLHLVRHLYLRILEITDLLIDEVELFLDILAFVE